ncbi:hypothetical protein FIU87_19365 [Bacillus sp. THAF10]|nr:hypothetical protein FIU87_19365 [Bacillus sp. THAF10]
MRFAANYFVALLENYTEIVKSAFLMNPQKKETPHRVSFH